MTIGPAPERLIDHTLLRPDTTTADIERLCEEAAAHGFWCVCVQPVHVERCVTLLSGTAVRVGTVAGFPLGTELPEAKAFEAQRAVELGAREIDMVINIGALLDGDDKRVAADVRAVREACAQGVVLKLIIETGYLDDARKRAACRIAMAEGADFVKTCTGFGPGRAMPRDIRLMREVVGPEFGVKAAGGIRTKDDFWTMVRAGANRIGTSSAVAIINEIRRDTETDRT
jgi:deoxyribose-phosphate aldolase